MHCAAAWTRGRAPRACTCTPCTPTLLTLQFGAGKAWWIGMGAGTGLAVGLTKAVLRVDTAPSFIDELRVMHVEPWSGLKVSEAQQQLGGREARCWALPD